MKKILIAVPCFDMVNIDFACSFINMEKPEGTEFTIIKNTLIYNARNNIAKDAVKDGFQFVLWLDSDMVFQPDIIARLSEDIDKGYDMVSGLYVERKQNPRPVLFDEIVWKIIEEGNVEAGASFFFDYPKDALFPCDGFGFGCVMVSVDLIKRVGDKYSLPFQPLLGLGEDLAFCWRAKQLGAKIGCDSRIKCGHIGSMMYTEAMLKGEA